MFFDLEADEVCLTDLIRFLSEDLSLGVAGDDFRFCSVFEADSCQKDDRTGEFNYEPS